MFRILHFGQQLVKRARLSFAPLSTSASQSQSISTQLAHANQLDDSQREVDDLIAHMEVLLKGHDTAVMDSYETFVTMACKELGLPIHIEARNRPYFVRMTLNRSPFIHKKCMKQYEFRTYTRTLSFSQLTGSTASVFLEYIQRNLPEGMAMHVRKERLEPLTEFLHKLNGDIVGGKDKG